MYYLWFRQVCILHFNQRRNIDTLDSDDLVQIQVRQTERLMTKCQKYKIERFNPSLNKHVSTPVPVDNIV